MKPHLRKWGDVWLLESPNDVDHEYHRQAFDWMQAQAAKWRAQWSKP